MKKIAAPIAVLAIVTSALLVIGLQPRPRALAAAVEGYIGGLGVSGTSYDIVRQTENEAEVIVYLEITENGQALRVPKDNLLLQRDNAGNWGIARATPIITESSPTQTTTTTSPTQTVTTTSPTPTEEWEPEPARLRVVWVQQPNYCVKMEPVVFEIAVFNEGDLRGTYATEVLVNGVLVENVVISADGWSENRTSVTLTFDKIGEYVISAAGEEWVITVRGVTDWWNDPVITASVGKVMDDYLREHIYERSLEHGELFKGEPVVSGGFGPYDREGDVVVIEGNIIYGTVPNLKEFEWLARIDLNTYQVVEFSEIAG